MAERTHSVLLREPKTYTINYWFVYALSVIFTYHGLIVAYSNSTFMEQFVTPEAVGAFYTIGSALSVFGFLFMARLLRKVGNVSLTIMLAAGEIIALSILGLSTHPPTLIVAFVAFLVLNPLIYLNIDIFSETLIGANENDTGTKRGLALSLMSAASIVGPLTMAYVVGANSQNLHFTYLTAAAVFLTFLLIVLIKFKGFIDPPYCEIKVMDSLQYFWRTPHLRSVLLVHWLLQMFFAFMVIYVPLYLATEIGFGWDVIGSIIAVGLAAYLLFEYPIGLIADRYIGEKEMMALGMLILAVTTSWMSFMTAASVTAWMVLMFVSRIGASLVEVTTESYFFKHTKGDDADVISFFRLTRPLALVFGALLGSATLLYLPFNLIFIVLGLALVPGIFVTLGIPDTK